MTGADSKPPLAWEPLTPPGVAAFAQASVRRLWLAQLVFALLAASVVVWFLQTAWFPTVGAAIRSLPAQGEIRDGKLNWPAAPPQSLAGGSFLSFDVDLEHEGGARSPADVQVEFGRDDLYVFSLFGYREFYYGHGFIVSFNRTELEPQWGAWRPPILWLTFGAMTVGLLAVWTFLAAFYAPVVWLVAFFWNRNLNVRASWKLAGAALMPGSLLFSAAIVLYGMREMDLLQLMAAFAAHWAIGWVYLFAAPYFAPKVDPAPSSQRNPFRKS